MQKAKLKGYIEFEQNGKMYKDPFEASELQEIQEWVNYLKMGGMKKVKVIFKGSKL